MSESQEYKENSHAVQAHLNILQAVIQRMASNSSSCKAWCITLVSAILVIVADKGKPQYAFIGVIPTLLFLILDAHYLALEKGFRNSYNVFIEKLHHEKIVASDLYAVSPTGNIYELFFVSLTSFSIWLFYLTLLGLVFVAKIFVLR